MIRGIEPRWLAYPQYLVLCASQDEQVAVVAREGIEPAPSEPKSDVLPLDDPAFIKEHYKLACLLRSLFAQEKLFFHF